MAENNKIPYLRNGISVSEIKNILRECVFSDAEKNSILSIFNELSNKDGVLNEDEWNIFIDKINIDHNDVISSYERSMSYETSGIKKLVYDVEKNDMVNFCNLMFKYVDEKGGKIPQSLVKLIEQKKVYTKQLKIDIEKLSTYIEYSEGKDLNRIEEYDNATGELLRIIKTDSDGHIKSIEFVNMEITCSNNSVKLDIPCSDTFEKQNEEENIGENEYIFTARRNLMRKEAYTDDFFAGNWLYKDKYKSKTLDEFMENMKLDGVEYDSVSGNNLAKKAKDTAGGEANHCGRHIFKVLNRVRNSLGERFSDGIERQHAYKFAKQLSLSKNFGEIPYNIASTMDLRKLPKGCVLVYDAHYKETPNKKPDTKYHKHGHISVTDGTDRAWGGGYYPVYDGFSSDIQKTHVRVFVPVKPYDKESGINN